MVKSIRRNDFSEIDNFNVNENKKFKESRGVTDSKRENPLLEIKKVIKYEKHRRTYFSVESWIHLHLGQLLNDSYFSLIRKLAVLKILLKLLQVVNL